MIGAMRHQVKIQSQSRSADGGGSSAVSYSDVATVNASIKPLAGGDRFFGDQIEERVTHMITIRFRRDVTYKNRLKYDFADGGVNYSRIFNIRRVINRDTRNRFLDILCEEGVAT